MGDKARVYPTRDSDGRERWSFLVGTSKAPRAYGGGFSSKRQAVQFAKLFATEVVSSEGPDAE